MTGIAGAVKTHTEYLFFNTKKRCEIVLLTPQLEKIVERSGIRDGFCFVSVMHITAAIYVNDLENGLIADIQEWLENLARHGPTIIITRPGKTMPMRI